MKIGGLMLYYPPRLMRFKNSCTRACAELLLVQEDYDEFHQVYWS